MYLYYFSIFKNKDWSLIGYYNSSSNSLKSMDSLVSKNLFEDIFLLSYFFGKVFEV